MSSNVDRSAGPADTGGHEPGSTQGALKRAAILETAWQLMSEKTIASITVDDLARGAGIDPATFDAYFDSLDAVLDALARVVVGYLLKDVEEFVEPFDEPPADVIRRIMAANIRQWRRDGAVLRAMIGPYETDLELRRFWDGIRHEVEGVVAAAIEREREAGRAPAGPPNARDLASVLAAMQWRAGYEASLSPASATADRRLTETLTSVFVRAVYGTDEPTTG